MIFLDSVTYMGERSINKNNKTAIITGITGQDGAYLCENLLNKGYKVVGTYRRSSTPDFWRLKYLNIYNHKDLELVAHEMTELGSAIDLINRYKPIEVYNLAAQSFVEVSFSQPITTAHINSLGALNFLEAIRLSNNTIKFYQASTSEMFGKVQEIPQKESTPFYPRSPYGISKLFAHWSTVNYRESYNIFACSGILFNHESPLRGEEFVTRKISKGVASLASGGSNFLELGNIDAERDWGFAGDYVEGMWRILQSDIPKDFVLATNQKISVRDFLKLCFEAADINAEFIGRGVEEVAIQKGTGKLLMKINPEYFRPSEVDMLIGDSSKAKELLNWEATTSIDVLAEMMVRSDINALKKSKI